MPGKQPCREMQLATLPQAVDPPSGILRALLARFIYPFRRGVVPEPKPATGFYTDTTVCIGCKACEVACKQWNQLPADGYELSGKSYDNTVQLSATSWRHVKFIEQFPIEEFQPVTVPAVDVPADGPYPWQGLSLEPMVNRWLMMSDVCKHCVTAPCQQACPTGAIVQTEFENILIQNDICNGCTYCVAACPFGVISRSSIDGHSHKCTLCYDRQRDDLVPACAKACPTESIMFGRIDDLREKAERRVADLHRRGVTRAYLYGDKPTDTYSQLNSFYLLVDRPSVYGLPDDPSNPWINMPGDYIRAIAAALAALIVFAVSLLLLGN
jgi:formate dehydrogenase iron-sulfur subunit